LDGGACQQAFAIVMTDSYWNGGAPLNTSIDNEDGDNGVPYADGYSDTLADVAMYYYENDLSSALEDEVPTNLKDGADYQHMVTYTVAFGVSGTLDPTAYDLESGPYPTWPDPAAGNAQKIDDVWHAAVNGRGEFLSAFDLEELTNALLSIKQNIEARTGSAAPVSVNGVELYEEAASELFMFQSTYNSDGWTGDVKAYAVNPTTGEVSETPEWSAADWLDATDTQWAYRRIATYNPSITPPGVPFTWLNLNAEQQAQLDPDVATAQDILAFLRGIRQLEQQYGGTFRNRFSILGDIVHSSPVFENGVLYAGANDGMLHAFRATDGSEAFAHIPNLVFANLHKLADPAYYDNHTFYVDLSPVIQKGVELSLGSAKTLLVGGLGKGGQGYYALDITGIDESTSFASDSAVADRVLWEFGGDPDLGYTYARPAIVNSQAGWIVIVGNGYNSTSGNAVLIILNASDGTELTRIDTGVGSCNGLSTPVVIDVNYDNKVDYVYAGDLKGNLWKFDLTKPDHNDWTVAYKDGATFKPLFQAPGQPITTKPDVMRHPTKHGYLVVFGTGKYLGITDFADTSLNTIYGVWDYGDDSDDSEYLGFFNRGSATNKLSNQPPEVTLLEQDYVSSPETDPNFPFFWTVAINGDQLKLRILTNNSPNWETEDDDAGELPNPGSDTEPPNTVHVGWYFDLPLNGERVASDVLIRDGKAIVISFTPVDEPCGIGGNSIVHEMDAASGGRLVTPQFDIDADAAIDTADLIEIDIGSGSPEWVAPTGLHKTGRLHVPAILRMGSTEMKYFSSSEGTIKTVRERPARLGVRYWRELE
jgi:type IV pilus assembly protein PilY1